MIAKYLKNIALSMGLIERRTNLVDDVINGIKTVKFNAWENIFYDLIIKVRESEFRVLGENHWYRGFMFCIFAGITALTSICCFGFYEVFVSELEVSKAFTVLVLVNLVVAPLGEFVESLYLFLYSTNSLKRVGEIVELEDSGGEEDGDTGHEHGSMEEWGGLIEIKEASLRHVEENEGNDDGTGQSAGALEEDEVELGSLRTSRCVLNDISLRVEPGSFSAIVGKVGSGKSSIILSILGELKLVKGSVNKIGSVAYISQEAFLMNDTVKNNILFGLDYEEVQYNKAVKISQLIPDFQILPQGDETEIGERGITLSGGQKQRVSIARAVYANADIYLIDDCLSALDAYVGRRVLEDVFLGELSSKTRLMVTHKLEVLESVDYVYLLEGGRVIEKGTFEEIQSQEGYKKFSQTTKKGSQIGTKIHARVNNRPIIQTNTDQKEKSSPSKMNQKVRGSKKSNGSKSGLKSSPKAVPLKDLQGRAPQEASSDIEQRRLGSNRTKLNKPGFGKSTKVSSAEDSEELSLKHYLYYISKGGTSGFFTTMLSFLIVTILKLTAAWWISIWASRAYKLSLFRYLISYVVINALYLLFILARVGVFSGYCLKISQKLFAEATWSLLRRPTTYFDVNPIGKIFNLFTNDIRSMDFNLLNCNMTFLEISFTLIGAFIGAILICPPVLVVLLIGCFTIRMRLAQTISMGNRLKRLELSLGSRYLSRLSELLSGRVVVNAFRVREKLIERFREVHDASVNSIFQQHVVYIRCVYGMNLFVWAIAICALSCVFSTKLGLR